MGRPLIAWIMRGELGATTTWGADGGYGAGGGWAAGGGWLTGVGCGAIFA
jgi:hypothetical protein